MELLTVLKVFMAILMSAQSVGQSTAIAPGIFLNCNFLINQDAGKAKQAAAVLFNIIDRVPSIDSDSENGKQLGYTWVRFALNIPTDKIVGEIEIKNADFEYPTRPDAKVFNGLSLYIEPGKVLALVGQVRF
jgi:ATP-binding cassette subfamily B (MDR/TAP) protein 1